MKANRELLEAQLAQCKSQVKGLKSFVKELQDKTTEHGTDRDMFEMDLIEAEHNIKYYEEAMTHIKAEINRIDKSAKSKRSQTGTDTVLPRTAKQCIGSFVFSSVSFVAGAILASKLKSRSESQRQPEKKGES